MTDAKVKRCDCCKSLFLPLDEGFTCVRADPAISPAIWRIGERCAAIYDLAIARVQNTPGYLANVCVRCAEDANLVRLWDEAHAEQTAAGLPTAQH